MYGMKFGIKLAKKQFNKQMTNPSIKILADDYFYKF